MASTVNRESVHDTLENLIEQFSDVYCFYRELIQNSLDAGTNRVDIWLEYIPDRDKKKDGVMIIHVDDYGEGMNREIIDSQLTRLFSSSKENDLTKIGKFGIGFVSVFAIKPQAVNIDTSRDGQDWRIIFNEKKEFERLKRDYPVDGTKIQIIKTCNEKFFNIFVKKSRETVEFWCKHSEAEIYFQDELINDPYDIDSPLKIHLNENVGDIVMGYTRKNPPFYGFYNQGLTLIEGYKRFYDDVSFKVKSKYLEHTLTRDDIRQDEHYHKVMDFLLDVAMDKLPIMLFESIEEELLKSDDETERYKELLEFALDFLLGGKKIPRACNDKKIARDTEGGFLTVPELIRLNNGIYFDSRSNPITQKLTEKKVRVVKTEQGSALHTVLKIISEHKKDRKGPQKACDSFFITYVDKSKLLTEVQKKLIFDVNGINKAMERKTAVPVFASFDYEDSCIADRVYLMQKEPGELTEIDQLDKRDSVFSSLFSLFSKTRTLVLNKNHPYIIGLLRLGERDRELASYLLTKLLYLDDGIKTETDSALVGISLERRGINV